MILGRQVPIVLFLIPALLQILLGGSWGGGWGAEGEGGLVEGDTRALIGGGLLQEPQEGGVHLPSFLELKREEGEYDNMMFSHLPKLSACMTLCLPLF